jgi:murein DD-endopeptidase MepM/ murein hydrolase activator NlpD
VGNIYIQTFKGVMIMNEEKGKKREKKWNGEKRFYLVTGLGATLAVVTIIVATAALSSGKNDNVPTGGLQSNTSSIDTGLKPDAPVVVTPEGMITPVEAVSVLNEYGFYHNKTLGAYYEHAGVDFAATAGTSVFAAESGVVESIYKDDLLLGTEIVLDHGDGLKTVYRFVTEAEGLKVGDRVEKGDVIATVAEANGNEYKDGAHLHFEILKEGKSVDPTIYLTLEEK